MKVLLAGDSWGIGVYQKNADGYQPTGQGIHTFIQCQNISEPGISNTKIINNIRHAEKSNATIFLQTDIFRENSYHGVKGNDTNWRWLHESFIQQLLKYSSIEQYISDYFQTIYALLDELAKSRQQKILCIGGWSDLHPSIINYTNLIPLVYSSTQLLIPSSLIGVYISDFEYFLQLDNTAVKEKFNVELKEIALASSKKFELSCQHWGDVHPNLAGYEVLAKKINNYLL